MNKSAFGQKRATDVEVGDNTYLQNTVRSKEQVGDWMYFNKGERDEWKCEVDRLVVVAKKLPKKWTED